MKNIQTFKKFLNEGFSFKDSEILYSVYKDGSQSALKNFKDKFLKGSDFEMGGVIHIHGDIKGSMAVETRIIDVYHFDEEDPEVTNLTTWTCKDKINGGDSGWSSSTKKNVYFSKEVEALLHKGNYDSTDYSDQFLVFFDNPDYNNKPNSFVL